MGWWLGCGFERKGRYLSLGYAKKVCVYSQRTGTWGRKQRRGCTCKLKIYILHVIRPAPKRPLGWSCGTSVKQRFSIYFANFERFIFQQNTRPTNIKQVYSSLIECFAVMPVCQKKVAMTLNIQSNQLNNELTHTYIYIGVCVKHHNRCKTCTFMIFVAGGWRGHMRLHPTKLLIWS